jgi:glycogen debranching enzyme
MNDALEDQAVGTIGEIFDGDPPHHPRGAPVQAWSVACTLDAWRRLSEAEAAARGANDEGGAEPTAHAASN